jgi:hypothetical protein
MKIIIFTNQFLIVIIPIEKLEGITFSEMSPEKGLPKGTNLVDIFYDLNGTNKSNFYVDSKCKNAFIDFLTNSDRVFNFCEHPHED